MRAIKINTEHWPILLIIASVALLYIKSLSFEFLNWDDNTHITELWTVQGLTWLHIKGMFTQLINKTYIPLTTLSFALEYHFFGYNPFFFHLNNVILHALVSCLVYVFAIQFGLVKKGAFIAALIFAVHPMHVESVAWLTERKDVLYSAFYLLSMISYVSYIKNQKYSILALSIIFGLLSMLSKPMALSLPLILLLLDWVFKRKISSRLIIEKIPYCLYILPLLWVTFAQNTNVYGTSPTILQSFLMCIWSFTFYIKKFFFPFVLSPGYVVIEPINLKQWEYVFGLFLFAALILVSFINRRSRYYIFAMLYFVFSIFFLLRFDSSTYLNWVADRFMYLPSMGICLLLGYGVQKFYNVDKQRKMIVIGITSLVCGFLIVKSWVQIGIWENSVTLWSHVIKHYPQHPVAFNNRGYAYSERNMPDLALLDYEVALKINPNHASTLHNQAVILSEKKDYQSALKAFDNSLSISSSFQSYYNRANLYKEMGDITAAIEDYTRAIEVKPTEASPYINRGVMYLYKKNFNEAMDDFDKAIKLDPRNYLAYNNRALVHINNNKLDLAIIDLTQCIKIQPNFSNCYYNRANTFRKKKNYKRSLEDFDRAITLGSGSANLFLNRSLLFYDMKRYNESLEDVLKARSLGLNIHEDFIVKLKKLIEGSQDQ